MLKTLLAFVLTGVSGFAWCQEMEPGEWQFDATVSSPMFPQPQTTTFTRCVKPGESSDPAQVMGKPQASDCAVTSQNATGDGYTWEMACPASNMRGRGTVHYRKGAFEGEMEFSGEMQGTKLEMHNKMTGRRLGPCK
jgi:hypothetical protein